MDNNTMVNGNAELIRRSLQQFLEAQDKIKNGRRADFLCKDPDISGKECVTWTGTIRYFRLSDMTVEADITGRGTLLHAVIGRCLQGFFICFLNVATGTVLATPEDVFWNRERLSQCIGHVDAITVSEAFLTIRDEFV